MPLSEGRAVVLRLSGVTVEAGGRAILNQVDLSVLAGERIALIGPSGAGKTTLLRVAGASLWADAGEVCTLGVRPASLRGRALRRLRQRVGFLRQRDNLIPPLRVAHNVSMGQLGSWSTLRSLAQLLWPTDLDRVRKALRTVELEDRLWALPEDLSGGEQQRVALARLMVQEPELLLADEPVSALDIRLGTQVIELLLGLARDRGAGLVVSLHSLDLLRRGFDRVVALRDGSIHWQGAPEDLGQQTLREVYGTEYHGLDLAEQSGE